MGWFASPEGQRGYFADDLNVPQDWQPILPPDQAAEPEIVPEIVPENIPVKKSAKKAPVKTKKAKK